jgi:hypothetical protein
VRELFGGLEKFPIKVVSHDTFKGEHFSVKRFRKTHNKKYRAKEEPQPKIAKTDTNGVSQPRVIIELCISALLVSQQSCIQRDKK